MSRICSWHQQFGTRQNFDKSMVELWDTWAFNIFIGFATFGSYWSVFATYVSWYAFKVATSIWARRAIPVVHTILCAFRSFLRVSTTKAEFINALVFATFFIDCPVDVIAASQISRFEKVGGKIKRFGKRIRIEKQTKNRNETGSDLSLGERLMSVKTSKPQALLWHNTGPLPGG